MKTKTFATCGFVLSVFLAHNLLLAQSDFAISPFSGYTPGQAMPGSPAGSYRTGNFETYNPASGLANINLPLFTVKGRGPVTIPVTLPLSQTMWTATATQYDQAGDYGYVVDSTGWDPLTYQFGTARLLFRFTGDVCTLAPQGGFYRWLATLTRATLVMPDGTETEFVDTKTGGTPETAYFDRGGTFISDNGSFTELYAGDVHDLNDVDSCPTATGEAEGDVVTMRDGTEYTFQGGYVSTITDRNGNLTIFSPQAGGFSGSGTYDQFGNTGSITDSLGRTYQWTYNTDASGKHYYTVQYPGTDGATRTITIWYASLDSVLAPGESIQTFGQLWPGLPAQGSNLNQTYDPNDRVSEVDLPDGSKYTFTYHSYGDVAQITLPTGGVIQYDYSTSTSSWNDSPVMYLLTRPLKERREYLGGALVSRTDYSGNEIDTYDGTGALASKITYSIASNGTGPTSGTNYNPPQYNEPLQINYYDKDGVTLLKSQTFTWGNGSSCTVDCAFLQQRTTTINGSVRKTTYAYDGYNNLTDEYDYDWGVGNPGGLLRHIHTSYNTDSVYVNLNILTLPSQRAVYDGAAGNLASASSYAYDNYGTSGIADAPGINDHNGNYGTSYVARGNLTSEQNQIDSSGSVATSTYTYNIAGDLISATDPNSHTVTFGYDTNYAWPTSILNALNQQTSISYDASLGKPISTTDLNGHITSFAYNDSLNRLTEITLPDGGHSYYSYPSPTQVVTQQDQNSPGDAALKSQTLYDGFGRAIESDTFENASQYIATTTQYDALGRVASTTNPSRPGDGLNYATTYSYDALGRPTQVKTADGAIVTTSYSGNQTTVTDQAGNSKTMTYDALGRLTSVVDATGTTTYTYNALGNLIKVVQGGQTRTFAYDMLGRLTQATNPESGTVTYAYDAAGNLTSRTDARGVKTTYTYDALNRLVYESYSDSTPAVSYSHDTGTNGKGHLTGYSNQNSASGFTFDAMGRVVSSDQVTAPNEYNFSYTYNLAGALTSETYPSGRVLTMSYDGANRPAGVSGQFGSQQTNYVSGVSYAPQGAPLLYSYKNGLTRSQSYNNRLQLSSYQDALQNSPNYVLFTANLNWGTTNNNGSLLGETDYEGGPGPLTALTKFVRTYTYDGVNRLTAASDSGGWSRTFGYDPYGNMWVTAASGVPLAGNTPTSNVYNSANNQINGGSYDAAGNQLAVSGDTLAYDANGHVTSATDNVTHNTETYIYDGGGQRVMKFGPSGETVYVYDAFGQLAAEYSTVPQNPPCATCYLSYDQRGDVRLVTDQNGNAVARHDYLPFGTEVPANIAGRNGQWGSTTDVEQKFTGQIRDTETGMDYFHARYYGSAFGRFTSPDPANAGAVLGDPQSWNAYGYVGSNPLVNVDPLGLSSISCGNDSDAKSIKTFCTTVTSTPLDSGEEFGGGGGGGAVNGGVPYQIADQTTPEYGFAITPMPGEYCGGLLNASLCSTAAPPPNNPITNPGPTSGPGPGPTPTDPSSPPVDSTPPPAPKPAPPPTPNDPASRPHLPDKNTNAEYLADLAQTTFKLGHPLDMLAVNASMFFVAGAQYAAAATVAVGGCAEPTPAEPLTCAGGLVIGASLAASATADTAFGGYFFKKYTLPAIKDWGN